MGKGRGSANRTLVLGLAALIVMAMAQPTLATVHYATWSYSMATWTRGKTFRAGDYIVFSYNKSLHNLVRVSGYGYNTCTRPSGSLAYQTGKDYIKLVKGANYFLCSFPGHCKAGMKLAVYAY
ncbi:basic blue protein-like [Silene latifolia]|uniref:basic blue protein-like n=1 Tax=Silene latifolia TaxID=37657 RepID=UPI003D787E54